MGEVQIGPRARRAIGRLAAVDVTRARGGRRACERALEHLFGVVGMERRPVRWAEGARRGFEQACGAPSAAAELAAALSILFQKSGLGGLDRGAWDAAWTQARAAVRDDVWGRVKWTVRRATASVAERYVVARGEESRRRAAARLWQAVWDEVVDVTMFLPLAAADRAGFQAEGGPLPARRYAAVWGPFIDAYEAGLWLFWVTEREVVAVSRPALALEENGRGGSRFHCLTGPAISFRGGESFYFIHGVEVGAEIVETPAGELDPRLVLTEENAEVRREIVRKVGAERLCEALNAVCVDRAGDYELLLLDMQDGRMRPFLKMRNPSLGLYHIEGVAPECRTVAEALTWRNQTSVPPSKLT